MQTTAIIVWMYGALVLVGGVMGWVKARSKPSLISGLAFGVLLGLCGVAMWQGRRVGLTTGAGLALGLALIMGVRYVKTKNFMPAGLMTLLSVVTFVFLAWALRS